MSHLLHYPNKAGNLQLCRPIVSLGGGEKSGEKEHRLNCGGRRPATFWNDFVGGCVENHGSKAKFLGGIQVYLECLFRIVVHQCRRLAQGFLNAQK